MGKTDNGVWVTCYRQKKYYPDREKAKQFYLEGAMSCDGSEALRYMNVYLDILFGKAECTDGE